MRCGSRTAKAIHGAVRSGRRGARWRGEPNTTRSHPGSSQQRSSSTWLTPTRGGSLRRASSSDSLPDSRSMSHVVTISPKRLSLARARTRTLIRAQIVVALADYRPEVEGDTGSIRLYFSPRHDPRGAKDEVTALLDAADRRWRRAFALYPTESSLRERST